MRTAKTLIRRGACPGLSEFFLCWAHMTFYWFCHEAAHIAIIAIIYHRMRQVGRDRKISDNHKKEYSCPMCENGVSQMM